jgi:hypothetical protein
VKIILDENKLEPGSYEFYKEIQKIMEEKNKNRLYFQIKEMYLKFHSDHKKGRGVKERIMKEKIMQEKNI